MKQPIARLVRAARRPQRPAPTTIPDPVKRAVVIDLDNIGLPGRGQALAVLTALLEAAGPYDVALACGRDYVFETYQGACVRLGVNVSQAPAVRNGADQVLLAGAGALGDVGVGEFVVISGDHAFAALPGRIHVVAPADRALARALTDRAASLTLVDVPRACTDPAVRRRRHRPRPGRVAPAAPALLAS